MRSEFNSLVKELQVLSVKEKLDEIKVKIEEYEKSSRKKELERAEKIFATLSEQLSNLMKEKQ